MHDALFVLLTIVVFGLLALIARIVAVPSRVRRQRSPLVGPHGRQCGARSEVLAAWGLAAVADVGECTQLGGSGTRCWVGMA